MGLCPIGLGLLAAIYCRIHLLSVLVGDVVGVNVEKVQHFCSSPLNHTMRVSVGVSTWALGDKHMLADEYGHSTASAKVVRDAALCRCPYAVPARCVAAFRRTMHSCGIKLVFLYHEHINFHGA